jgi:hypothetical protein
MQPNVWYTKEEIEKMDLKLSDAKNRAVICDTNIPGKPYYHCCSLGEFIGSSGCSHIMLITPPTETKKRKKK